MKQFIRNLMLALPLLFAVGVATPTKADAQIIVIKYPRYEYRLVRVWGLQYQYVNIGGYLVLQPVWGWTYQYQLVLVY